MKKIVLFSLTFVFFCFFLNAQEVPQGINYQAVARDASGQTLSDVSISVKVSLLTNIERGGIAYREVHDVMTNKFGLFNLTIGQGIPMVNDFESVPWDEHQIWMEIAMDEDGGDNFKVINTTKLLTVPYAFHAGSANRIGRTNKPGNEERVPWWGQPWWNIQGLEKTNPDKHFVGNIDSVDLVFRTNNLERLRIKANGEIIMPGDVEIGGTLEVKGDSTIVRNLYVQGAEAVIDSFLYVGKDASFGDNVTIVNNITAGGDGTFENIQALNLGRMRNLIVKGPGAVGPNSEHVALFENTEVGDGDGIAIKINNPKNSTENNFITFYNGDSQVIGRIEGYNANVDNFLSDFPQVGLEDFFDFGLAPTSFFSNSSLITDPGQMFKIDSWEEGFVTVAGAFASVPIVGAVVSSLSEGESAELDFSPGSFQSFAFDQLNTLLFPPLQGGLDDPDSPLGKMVCWAITKGLDGLITTNPFDLALAATVISQTERCKDGGVIYGSGGADYAEWLEKADPNEKFTIGQIVGVRGGKISKKTEGAEQIMCISTAPIVLGNMPAEKEKENFEMVGFMGQVPVLVKGKAAVGDFIIASGNNDGWGVAIKPTDLKLEQMHLIIGKAWTASTNDRINMINVAIGLNRNDIANVMLTQQKEIEALKASLSKLEHFESRLEKLETIISQ